MTYQPRPMTARQAYGTGLLYALLLAGLMIASFAEAQQFTHAAGTGLARRHLSPLGSVFHGEHGVWVTLHFMVVGLLAYGLAAAERCTAPVAVCRSLAVALAMSLVLLAALFATDLHALPQLPWTVPMRAFAVTVGVLCGGLVCCLLYLLSWRVLWIWLFAVLPVLFFLLLAPVWHGAVIEAEIALPAAHPLEQGGLWSLVALVGWAALLWMGRAWLRVPPDGRTMLWLAGTGVLLLARLAYFVSWSPMIPMMGPSVTPVSAAVVLGVNAAFIAAEVVLVVLIVRVRRRAR